MYSIFGVFDIKTNVVELHKKALELSRLVRYRDPDWSSIYTSDNATLAHERLSIADVNAGAQPFYDQQKTHVLAINGEVYSHQALRAEYDDRCQFWTGSDCEAIPALYQKEGPEFLNDLQSMFTFTLCDSEKDTYLVGRDHLGIIPLYIGYDEYGQPYVASEMRAPAPACRTTKKFPAGSYLWSQDSEIRSYYYRGWFDSDAVKDNVTSKNELRQTPEDPVKSHLMSNVLYGVLFSGGLGSSIIPAITKKYATRRVEDQEHPEAWWPQLHSFAVGLPGSPDLETAQGVADHLGMVHYEIRLTVWESLDVIHDVIYHIKTHDVTAIRASIPVYLTSRKIEAMGTKMVLSGEDSDEAFGGYLCFHKAPNAKEPHKETVCKLLVLHMYDCVRVNKTMSARGMETHAPFLGKRFLDVAMRTDPQNKICGNSKMERCTLREYFKSYLPTSMAWWQKEQFSDGVSHSWIDTLKGMAAQQVSDQQLETVRLRPPYNTLISKEAYLYQGTSEELLPFPSAAECVPDDSSVVCFSAKAIEWDEASKKMDDPPGRVVGVCQPAYR